MGRALWCMFRCGYGCEAVWLRARLVDMWRNGLRTGGISLAGWLWVYSSEIVQSGQGGSCFMFWELVGAMYVGSMTQWVGTRQAGAQRGGLGQGNWHVTGLVEVRWVERCGDVSWCEVVGMGGTI